MPGGLFPEVEFCGTGLDRARHNLICRLGVPRRGSASGWVCGRLGLRPGGILLVAVDPFPAGAIAGWLALGAYLALYTGAWVWFCWRLLSGLAAKSVAPASQSSEAAAGIQPHLQAPATARPQPVEPSAWLARAPAIGRFLELPAWVRVLWAMTCAATWVALEMLLARLFTGFPWNLLGVSQYQILPVIQIAAWTGVYGVSFLVAWFSVAMAAGALALLARPTQSKAWVADLILPLVALLVVIGYGSTELARPQPQRRTLRAVLIQPSIPQTLIWDTNQNAIRFTQLIELSERALNQTSNAQVLVWPEAAVPNMLRYEWDTYTAVTNLAISHRVWMILGSDDAVRKEGGLEREYDFYNSSFLITPEGELDGHYRKRRLVIFGEYIPLEHWIPFMKYLHTGRWELYPGARAVPVRFPRSARQDFGPDLLRRYLSPLQPGVCRAGHGLSLESDEQRVVWRKRRPMAARGQRCVSDSGKRHSPRALRQQRVDLLGG